MVLEFSARALAASVSILHTHTPPATCRPGGSCLHTWLGAFTPRLRPFHTWTTQPPPRDLSSICLQKGCLFPSENRSNQHFPLARVAYQQLLHKVRNCNFSFSFAWLASPFCPLSVSPPPAPHPQPSVCPLRSPVRMNDRINFLPPPRRLTTPNFQAALPSVLTRFADRSPHTWSPFQGDAAGGCLPLTLSKLCHRSSNVGKYAAASFPWDLLRPVFPHMLAADHG